MVGMLRILCGWKVAGKVAVIPPGVQIYHYAISAPLPIGPQFLSPGVFGLGEASAKAVALERGVPIGASWAVRSVNAE